jgi:prepilin-type N-terminal cleavage/methylation domain-containing protein/prepilin-type processing-associated H-X9-DG protein
MIAARVRRSAFTLIELLVVIAIIAILIGLLVPAVQKVREAAARAQCQNNLKQLGLAYHNYENVYKALPPSAYDGFPALGQPGPPAAGWGLFILPYIEQGPLYQQYNWTYVFFDTAHSTNQTVANTVIPVMTCPSAPARTAYTALVYQQFGVTWQAAPSDYTPLAGVNASLVTLLGMTVTNTTGALQPGTKTRILAITDGTSNTMLLAEIAGRNELWQNGHDAGKTLDFTHGGLGGWADASSGHSSLYGSSADGTVPVGTTVVNASNDYGLYSFHTGGANQLFCDGSVRFISAGVSPNVVVAQVTKAGGEVNASE